MKCIPHSKGVTLVETIVVIGILALITAALFSTIVYFYRGNAYVFEAATSVDSARRGVSIGLSSLREASYGEDGTYPITVAATSSITFYSDIDTDGGIEKVRFVMSNDTLYRGITNSAGNPPSYTGQAEATSTIATYVRNTAATPIFTYYDSTGVQLSTTSTNISNIATVRMDLRIDLNPARAPNIFTLAGSATLRNLKEQ